MAVTALVAISDPVTALSAISEPVTMLSAILAPVTLLSASFGVVTEASGTDWSALSALASGPVTSALRSFFLTVPFLICAEVTFFAFARSTCSASAG